MLRGKDGFMRSSRLLPKSETRCVHGVTTRSNIVHTVIYCHAAKEDDSVVRAGRTEEETVQIARGISSHIVSSYDMLSY